MTRIGLILVLSFIISFSCNESNSNNNEFTKLIVSSSLNYNDSDFATIDCRKELKKLNLKESQVRVQHLEMNSRFDSNTFVKLIIINKNDSIWFNVEQFLIKNSDTLRISNFGGRQIPRANHISAIKETVCKFLNK